jgi:hypothetical protein
MQLDRRLRHGHPIEAEIATNGQPFQPEYDVLVVTGNASTTRSARLLWL